MTGWAAKEATNLEDLVQRIKRAEAKGLLFNPNPGMTDTVHFWCKQVVLTLQDPQKEAQANTDRLNQGTCMQVPLSAANG